MLVPARPRPRGRSSMVEHQLPKLTVRVRFPSPAPNAKNVATEPHWRIPVLCETVFSVHTRATLGHTYPHLGTQPSVFKGRSACSVVDTSVLPTSPGGLRQQVDLACDRPAGEHFRLDHLPGGRPQA